VLDHMGGWSDVFPLVEFTYNNNYHSNISMAPYEALYGRQFRTPLCWNQDGESLVLGPEFLQQTSEKVKTIQERMLWDEITQEMTWEMEDPMRQSYPHLFPGKCYFRGRKS